MWTSLSLRPTGGAMQWQRRLVRLARQRQEFVVNDCKFPSKDQCFLQGMRGTRGAGMGRPNGTELPRRLRGRRSRKREPI